MPSLISIVHQTPQSFRTMGAEHFRAIEYEAVHKLSGPEPPREGGQSEAKEEKSKDEVVNYVVRGKGKCVIGDKEYSVRAGSIIYASPSQLIDVTPTKLVGAAEWTLDYLYFCIRM